MLLLGVVQAQAAGGAAVAGSFDLLETQVLGTAVASITFSSLSTYAADYQHLQIRAVMRNTSVSANTEELFVQLNADTATNYSSHRLVGASGSVTSAAYVTQNKMRAGWMARNGAVSGYFGACVIDILDAFETTKYTTIRVFTGTPTNEVALFSGNWRNTNALTEVKLFPEVNDFIIGSRFSLYGIRGG